MQVSEVQRARILGAAVQVVSESGYAGMSVARVTGRAGISRRTFYDLFKDREDCFLAVLDDAIARARAVAGAAYEMAPDGWREKVRAALGALLGFFDDEPGVGALLVVDSLGAGPRALERRTKVLEQLARALDKGHSGNGSRGPTVRATGARSSPLTAEGVVGGVLAVIQARLLKGERGHLTSLLNPLTGMIVLPYEGAAAARRELARPLPKHVPNRRRSVPVPAKDAHDPLEGLGMRITYRTLRVLDTIAANPGASNRQVGESAGVHDQGQISKLLARLQRLGLVANTGQGQPKGEPNAWTLTQKGAQVQDGIAQQTTSA